MHSVHCISVYRTLYLCVLYTVYLLSVYLFVMYTVYMCFAYMFTTHCICICKNCTLIITYFTQYTAECTPHLWEAECLDTAKVISRKFGMREKVINGIVIYNLIIRHLQSSWARSHLPGHWENPSLQAEPSAWNCTALYSQPSCY